MRGAVVCALLAACGGGATRSADVGNRGRIEGDAWTCPAGDELEVRLDDDALLDRVRLAPSAQAATCLEIHATRTAPLVCSEVSPPRITQVETSYGAPPEVVGEIACDPMGVHVTAFSGDRLAVMLGEAAPTRTGLRLSGGDATAVLVWREGRWTWIALGF